ncbi:MAG: nickel pincer cofactor biosynthesis protein LarB [Candidatus Omnitrophica bacterium]|nr:nickel pincer cofactor biosynthesis protein LarB [Candidatus Omnitrophota bacterium]
MYTQKAIQGILARVSKKKLSPKKAFDRLRHLSYESLHFAHLDHHRMLRKNLPEVIYAPGKSLEQIEQITSALLRKHNPILITRLDERRFRKLERRFKQLSYSKKGQIAYSSTKRGQVHCAHNVPVPFLNRNRSVAIVTAGTSDICIAEEARITLEAVGRKVRTFYDLGVAGLHRLLDHIPEIEKANVIICIAGMEGALPSVLAGLVSKPVIAVPTSVGYGSSFKGVAPLLTMLNSCAQGVAVVNIDSGFNAACFAHLICSR